YFHRKRWSTARTKIRSIAVKNVRTPDAASHALRMKIAATTKNLESSFMAAILLVLIPDLSGIDPPGAGPFLGGSAPRGSVVAVVLVHRHLRVRHAESLEQGTHLVLHRAPARVAFNADRVGHFGWTFTLSHGVGVLKGCGGP